MRIIDNTLIELCDLNAGEVFKHNGQYYMKCNPPKQSGIKINKNFVLCVDLENGNAVLFGRKVKVEWFDARWEGDWKYE